MSTIDKHFRKCNVFKIRSTVSLVSASGLQPDLKELGTFSGTPTRILVTLILSLWYQIMYLSGKNRKLN